jgi:hypothetical protein
MELVKEYAGGLGVNVKAPLLQYVLMASAPYFMEAARRTLRRLTEGNLTEQHQEHTTPNKEKCWMMAGPEFGPKEGNHSWS